MTLMSHGVAAACKAAFNGFDSHQRLDATNCRCGLHLKNVRNPNHSLIELVLEKPQLPVGTPSTPLGGVPKGTMSRRYFVEALAEHKNH